MPHFYVYSSHLYGPGTSTFQIWSPLCITTRMSSGSHLTHYYIHYITLGDFLKGTGAPATRN